MITIVNYGRGNLFSMSQALQHLGASFEITGDPVRVAAAETVILPGVGAFGDASESLRSLGLDRAIRAVVGRGRPFLGICVGMQLLADRGEEFGIHDGLGLVPGTVSRLPDSDAHDAIRIPNVGWRQLRFAADPMWQGLPEKTMVYFVHSFAFHPSEARDVAACLDVNGLDVTAAVRRGNIIGFQFHPEKSGEVGLELLRRFLRFGNAA